MKTYAQQQREKELARAREILANLHLSLAKHGNVKKHLKAAGEYRRASHG